MADKMSVAAFASSIKTKYPQYADMHDDELARAMIQKYPVYADQVDMRTFKPSTQLKGSTNTIVGGGGIDNDFTTSGAEEGFGAYLKKGAQAVQSAAVGAGKGIIGTGYNIAKGVINTAKNRPADTPLNPDFENALTDKNAMETTGHIAEQAGEFAAGEGLATAGTKAVLGATKVPKLLAAAGRVARGAAVGGTVAAAEGGDAKTVKTGAAIGGAGAAVGEGLEAASKSPLVQKLVDSAKKSYERTLGATKETMKNMAGKVVGGYEVAGEKVPGLIDRGVTAWTRKGLSEQAANEVSNLGEQIDNLWSAIPEGEKIPAQPIKAALAEAKAKFVEAGPPKPVEVPIKDVKPNEKILSLNHKAETATVERSDTAVLEPAAHRNLSRMEKMVDTLTDTEGNVDVRSLRKAKGVFDKVVAEKGGYAGKQLSVADSAGVMARKEAANAFREELAKQYPDVAALNREFHFWDQVHDVIDETLKRTSSQSQPMGQQLAKVAGAAATGGGGVAKAMLTGEAMSTLRKITTSAGWNTKVAAATKMNLARALASGNAAEASGIMSKIAFSLGVSATRKDEGAQ
jgi:hypothetical protein